MVNQQERSEIIGDRVKFKLYATKHHLIKLEDIENRTGSLVSNERIEAEIEIDSFLSEIIGVKDALLHDINAKLNLGIPPQCVDLGQVNRMIVKKGVHFDMTELNTVSKPPNWLWILNEYRNHSLHRSLIPRFISVQIGVTGHKTYLLKDPRDLKSGPSNLEVILYFKECLQRMSELVERTRSIIP